MAGSYNPINNREQYLSNSENKGFFSKILRNLSSFGVDIEGLRNQVGIGINEDPYAQKTGDPLFDLFSQKAISSVMQRKSIPYLNKSYADKRRILMEYSIKDEIRTYVERICDEAIVYSDEQKFCTIKALPSEYSQDIRDKFNEYFENIYNSYEFADGITAWNKMKKLLTEGYMTYEIIWDDKKQNIIKFHELPSWTIVPSYEPTIDALLWIQYPEDPQIRKIFLDSQIIHISYSNHEEFMETSYVEGLIKPYNLLKILEQTKIMFNIINASVYQQFNVPVDGMSRPKAEEQINELIANYAEEVEWDDSLGLLTINGSKHLNFNKQLWFPKNAQGSVEMQLVSPDGHNLNENDMLNYFSNNLKRASKIPFMRLEPDNGGGTAYNDIGNITSDEATFSKFLDRLRVIFKELITKPLRLQMCLEFPELIDDKVFLNAVNLDFNKDQMFEKAKKIANIEKMSNTVQNLMGIQRPDGTTYFSLDYLMEKYLGVLSPDEVEENKAYLLKFGAGGSSEGGEGGGDNFGGDDFSGGNDFGGGGDDFGDDTFSVDDSGGDDLGGDDEGGSSPDTGDIELEF